MFDDHDYHGEYQVFPTVLNSALYKLFTAGLLTNYNIITNNSPLISLNSVHRCLLTHLLTNWAFYSPDLSSSEADIFWIFIAFSLCSVDFVTAVKLFYSLHMTGALDQRFMRLSSVLGEFIGEERDHSINWIYSIR